MPEEPELLKLFLSGRMGQQSLTFFSSVSWEKTDPILQSGISLPLYQANLNQLWHNLSANFSIWVGEGVDVHVGIACSN